ncbi:YvcK family protein [Euhalothece natronophila Z-M001]|uniref:Putative gluconeogenesis factor n=1 Tax=Euhalothece natronophila Z-M001 TaxID=522448 RepID=A0A5B8NKY9_9CHRO|nr:YvcK family protein [Euhalothece natronophila Z-M001]
MANPLIKRLRRQFQKKKPAKSVKIGSRSRRLNRWFMWLAPGIFIKRWLFISILGVLLTSLGLAIWAQLTPIFFFIELISGFLETIATFVPSYISGPIALLLGLFLIFWGQSRTVGSISEVLNPDQDKELIDVLTTHRKLVKGPKIVAIGGGTGLSTLLRGIKTYSANISAIVTVADDGGSSGRLRREQGMLPPGDIRNCLAALADEEKLLTELFQYRFSAGEGLTGHSFGNLFLSAMNNVTGDLEQAISASSKVLAVRGQVLPATLVDMRLVAEMEDGQIIEGESQITEAGGKIRHLGCYPENPPALPAAVKAIEEADLILIGPGSLYTSIIPNLLVPEIRQALQRSQAPSLYICNIMTQPGETDDYTVSDHIRAIDQVSPHPLFKAVLAQSRSPNPTSLQRYAEELSHPVYVDREAIRSLKRRLVLANVMFEDPKIGHVRHDPYRLGKAIMRWYSRAQ